MSTYYTVRALKPIRNSGIDRTPGDASTQDFVVDSLTKDMLLSIGAVSVIGSGAAAPLTEGAAPTPVYQDGVLVGFRDASGAVKLLGGSAGQVAFTSVVPLDGNKYMGRQSVTGPVAFSAAAGAVIGGTCYVRLVADGVNAPTFPGMKEWGGSLGYNNTSGIDNQITFMYDGVDYFFSVSQVVGATPSYIPVVTRLVTRNGLTETGDANAGWVYTPTAANAIFAASQSGVSDKKIAANLDGWYQVTIASITAGGGPDLALQYGQQPLPYNKTLMGVYLNTVDSTYKVSTGGAGGQVPDVVLAPAIGDLLRIGRTGTNVLAQVSKDGGLNFTTIKTWAAPLGDLFLNAIGALPGNPISGLLGGNVVAAAADYASLVTRLTTVAGLVESGDAVAGWTYTPTGTNAAFNSTQAGTSDKKIAANSDGWFQMTLSAVNAGGGPDLALQSSQALAAYNQTLVGIYVNPADNTYKVSTGGAGGQGPDTVVAPAVGDVVRIGRQGDDYYASVSKDNAVTFTRVKTWSKAAGKTDLYAGVIGALATNPANNIRGGNVV